MTDRVGRDERYKETNLRVRFSEDAQGGDMVDYLNEILSEKIGGGYSGSDEVQGRGQTNCETQVAPGKIFGAGGPTGVAGKGRNTNQMETIRMDISSPYSVMEFHGTWCDAIDVG